MEIRYGEEKNLPIRDAVRGIILKGDSIGVAHLKTLHFMMLPGGGVDPGEDLETALLREMHEEAGVLVKVKEKLLTTIRDEDRWCHKNHIYLCEAIDETLNPVLTEQEEWLDLSYEYVPLKSLFKHYLEPISEDIPLENPLILDYIRARELLVLNKLLRKRDDFDEFLKEWINRFVMIEIDRPKTDTFPVHYGFVPEVYALDGKEQDVYVLGEEKLEVGTTFIGKVIAVLHRKDDVEDKLVVSNKHFTDEEILSLTKIYEQYFDTILIRNEESL